MKKLQGPKAAAELSEKVHRRWLRLHHDNCDVADPRLPEIGLTCHAGEDFGHPLEGISWVGMALTGLALKPGDTIGHALALGWNVEQFESRRFDSTLMSVGSQFDCLLWLHWAVSDAWPSDPSKTALRHDLEDHICRQADKIYGIRTVTVPSLHDLIRERFGPCPPEGKPKDASNSKKAFFLESWCQKCITKRTIPKPIDPLFRALRPLVEDARGLVLDEFGGVASLSR